VISAACDVVGLTKSFGQWVGSQFSDDDSGNIITGARSVFIGEGSPQAARISDKVRCHDAKGTDPIIRFSSPVFGLVRDIATLVTASSLEDCAPGAHPGAFVADGSRTVLIELWNAARVSDAIYPCNGKIAKGCDTAHIGGATIGRAGTKKRSDVSGWLSGTVWVLTDVVGPAAGLIGARSRALMFALKAAEVAVHWTGKATGWERTAGTVEAVLGLTELVVFEPADVAEKPGQVVKKVNKLQEAWAGNRAAEADVGIAGAKAGQAGNKDAQPPERDEAPTYGDEED
jgi:uncharacterized Zn-binding protein involved in type VI secretion